MSQIDVIIDGLDLFIEERIIVLATEIHAELTEDTPVDTGWARANWVPSVGQRYLGGTGIQRSPAQVAGAVARQQQGLAKLQVYQIADGDVFVSNNVPYIQILNEGHRGQAPSGFVQTAIDRAVREVT